MEFSIFNKMTQLTIIGIMALGFTLTTQTFAAETSNDVVHASDSWSDAAKEAWMQGKIETIFMLNKHLKSLDIRTDVEGHLAHLTGHVTTEVQKELAQQLALSIEGITDVTNDLKIDPGFKSSEHALTHQNSFVQAIEDASTTASIKTQFMVSDLKARDIVIDTTAGVVTLTGAVESEAHSDLAYTIANNTDAVEKVINNLKIIEGVAGR